MTQSSELVEALKQALKRQGLTYLQIAKALNLSESSIKRALSSGRLTLQRFEQICQVANLKLDDLVYLMEKQRERLVQLTYEQEKELVSDTRLLVVAVCVRNRWTFDDILRRYDLSETECIRHLARLDHLGLVELLPGNRIKLLVADDFRWIPGGPIERFFREKIEWEFLEAPFADDRELHLFATGMLAPGSIRLLHRKLSELAHEFAELQKTDAALPIEERKNVGMMMALRPWESSAFKNLRRHPPKI